MNTKFKLVALFLLISGFALNAQNGLGVEVGAFLVPVGSDYFSKIGPVKSGKDNNDIFRYYVDNMTEAEANDFVTKARNAGFNPRIINYTQRKLDCAALCGGPVKASAIKSIFFDFDSSGLRPASRNELNKLVQVLTINPNYKVRLLAHTDAKGSNEYNDALSQRRADAAKNYLVKNGITADRIVARTFGESDPIAKNSIGTRDTEEGRQLNRRVELRVYNGDNWLNDAVDPIKVPDHLKN
jgi:outer membrane protein OmpA-like peptidoglycan-associated protein